MTTDDPIDTADIDTTPKATEPSDHPPGEEPSPSSAPAPASPPQHEAIKASPDARTLAGLVLDVFAGLRTPGEAAEVLGVSTNRYYVLESRALAGLVIGCEPRRGGRQIDYEEKFRLERETSTALKQEVGRLTALLRLAQQTYGVKPVPADRKRQAQAAKKAGKRPRRRPTVRALKARTRIDSSDPATDAGDPPDTP